MTATLITTGIDRLIGEPGPNGGWMVRFRSTNSDMHHQLYVNGRYAGVTDTPRQRCFFLDGPTVPLSVHIAAVSPAYRTTDLSDQLPPGDRNPSWVFRPRIVRSVSSRTGDVIEILGDHATGDLSETPLDLAEAWPAWAPRWAFGEDRFGRGGFGYDGHDAPGIGGGAFGAGLFGIDTDLIGLEAALPEEGTHEIVLRSRGSDGQVTDLDPMYVDAAPPPASAGGLTASGYDYQEKLLTLQID